MEQSQTPLVDAVSDSLILWGGEAYQATLLFDNSVKNVAGRKVLGRQGRTPAKAPSESLVPADL